jgi:hypothetical protein
MVTMTTHGHSRSLSESQKRQRAPLALDICRPSWWSPRRAFCGLQVQTYFQTRNKNETIDILCGFVCGFDCGL